MVRGAEAWGIGKKNQWNGGMNKVTIQHQHQQHNTMKNKELILNFPI